MLLNRLLPCLAAAVALLPAPACAQVITIDNVDAGFSKTGTWTVGTSAAGKYGADYEFATATGNPGGAANATARWTPNLPSTGYYYVYTQYPQGTNRAPDAPFTLVGTGAPVTFPVNQQLNGGAFYYIGQAEFAAGTSGYVELGNNANPIVVLADAVRFEYVGTSPGPGPGGGGGGGGATSGPEYRGMWISRFEWPKSTQSATQTTINTFFTQLQASNFNSVFMQVRGQCETLYPSPEEPWGSQFGYTNPGYDPLLFAINAAHTRGLEFHAYINTHVVHQSGAGNPPPTGLTPPHPFFAKGNPAVPGNDEWCFVDSTGTTQPLGAGEDGYMWTSPGVPSFNTWVRRQILYVANNYNVDGVHFDRIRFSGTGSYDPISLARFAGPGNPASISNYRNWNRDQITRFLNHVYGGVAEVNANRPTGKRLIKVSTAPFPSQSTQLNVNQDLSAWNSIGAQDFFCPQVYSSSASTFQTRLASNFPIAHGRLVVCGMSRSIAGSATNVFSQVTEARNQSAAGSLVFSYTGFLAGELGQYPSTVFGNTVAPPPMPWLTSPTDIIIVGNVTGPDSLPVRDARITRTGSSYTTLSCDDGFYAILKAPASSALTLTAQKTGLPTRVVNVPAQAPGTVLRVNMEMTASSVAEWNAY